MKIKYCLSVIISIAFAIPIKAQHEVTDSIQTVATLKSLLYACRHVDFADAKVKDSGMFYKASPYIIYRGKDKKRSWRDFTNYNNADEKKAVDDVCYRINSGINQDSSYQILQYFTEKESEGVWHVLMISYKKKGVAKRSAFAFLKVNDRFGLGDID